MILRRCQLAPIFGLTAVALFALPAFAHAADGTWDRAWGKDVDSSQAGVGFEICTVAASCKPGASGGAGGEMFDPQDVAVDAAGNVYVADNLNSRIQKFDAAGNFLRAWGKDVVVGGGTGFEICTVAASCQAGTPFGSLGGEFNSALQGIGVDGAGNVYVADQDNHRIQKFDSSGNFLLAWGKDVVTGGGTGAEVCTVASQCKAGVTGALGGELSDPADVAADSSGNVYVTDRGNERIQKFDSSGTFLRAWGKDVDQTGGTGFEICTSAASCKAGVSGGLGGEFTSVFGVATDTSDNVYVADLNNQRIDKFDSAGNFQRAWGRDVVTGGTTGFEICTNSTSCKTGGNGSLGGEFFSPEGVAVDGAGNVYVADRSNDRVQRFDSSGNWQRAWGRDVVTGGTTGFEICTIAANCKAGTSGGLGGEFDLPEGVAADAAGVLYVADADNRRIQKFADPVTQPPPPDAGGGPAPPGDTAPPDTTITAGPKAKTKSKSASFGFSGADARAVAGFECKLDGGPFEACASPKVYTGLKKGSHTFSVRAIDSAGNVDPTPATQTWTVKKKRKRK